MLKTWFTEFNCGRYHSNTEHSKHPTGVTTLELIEKIHDMGFAKRGRKMCKLEEMWFGTKRFGSNDKIIAKTNISFEDLDK